MRNRLLKRIVGLALGLSMAIGVGVGAASNRQFTRLDADEAAFATCDFTTKSYFPSSSGYTGTWDYGTYTVIHGNNNGTINSHGSAWAYMKFGPKKAKAADNATVDDGYIKSGRIDSAITKIGIQIAASTVGDGGTTSSVTWGIGVYSDSGFTSQIASVALTSLTYKVADTYYLTPSLGGAWETNSYYQIQIHCTNNTTTNGLIWVEKIIFYHMSDEPTPETYTVTYDANGGSGTMTDAGSPYTEGATVTTKTNTFTRAGYVFDHWDTKADDTGTDYAEGATFTINADTTLYAQWVVDESKYSLTYDANDNSEATGSVPTDANEYSSGDSATVLGNTGTLARSGYVWGGWNTQANGKGTTYNAGDEIEITDNTTLYARWFANHSSDANLVITANYLNLDTTGKTSAAVLTATDGMQYSTAPGATEGTVKATALNSATNQFDNSTNSAILMGKEGAYLYNNDSFQKDIAKIELFTNGNASTSAAVAVQFSSSICSTSYTTSPLALDTKNHVYTLNSPISNARFFRIQVTTAYNAQLQIKITFAIPTTSVTVAPASVTLAPTATQQLTTTVLPANTTDTLSYLSSDNDVATVSDEGLITAVAEGTATITATSGGYSDTCVVTVENIPVITPDKTSTSGYTGDSEAIAFTYNYLHGSLGVSVQNSNVEAEIQNNDAVNHCAEVLISFINVGSSEVYLKDGSTTLATIEVSISASAVTITGMPASKLLRNGAILNLGSLITINAVGIYSNAVTWSTSADSVATVTQSGVVTGVSNGDAVITVTPNDYPAGAVSCTVTVANVACAVFGTDRADGSGVSSDSALKEIGGYEIDSNISFSSFTYCYAVANKSMKFGTSSAAGSITVGLTNGEVDNKAAYITRIVVTAETYNTDSTTISIAGESKTLTSSLANYEVEFDNYNTRTVTISANAASKNRFRISSIYLYYEFNIKASIRNNSHTLASLAYNYTQTGPDSYSFSKTSIRFGGFMDKVIWDRLDTESEIQGYGVLVSTDAYLGGESFKEWYEFFDGEIEGDHTQKDVVDELIDGTNIKGFYTEVPGDKEHPAEATNDQKVYMGVDEGDDYYVWTFRKTVAEADLTTSYVGVAFIVIDGDIVFLQQTSASAQSLAQDLIDNTDATAESYDGSLGYLASL